MIGLRRKASQHFTFVTGQRKVLLALEDQKSPFPKMQRLGDVFDIYVCCVPKTVLEIRLDYPQERMLQ